MIPLGSYDLSDLKNPWIADRKRSTKSHIVTLCLNQSRLMAYLLIWQRKQRRIQGRLWGLSPPLDEWNLLISGGFQTPTGAEAPHWKDKKCKPPLDKFLNTPLKERNILPDRQNTFRTVVSEVSFLISFVKWTQYKTNEILLISRAYQ